MQLIKFNNNVSVEEAAEKALQKAKQRHESVAFQLGDTIAVAMPYGHKPQEIVEAYEKARLRPEGTRQTVLMSVPAGATITATCREAIEFAKAHNADCSFSFNDVLVTAEADSEVGKLTKFYHSELDRLQKEYQESEDYKRRQEEARKAAEEQNRRLGELLHHAPEKMTIAEGKQEAWDKWCGNNTDPYGNAVVRYADMWARLMEGAIAAGKKLEDVAKETSHDADTEGITGFMYGCAVRMLSDVWVHGEELRRWHNKDYGQPDSSGVVNPSVLIITP